MTPNREWPFDYYAEHLHRIKIMRAIEKDRSLRAAIKVHYANSPIDFIQDICVTYDPRAAMKTMPFILFPRQKEFVDFILSCVEDKQSGLVEKSRDIGATYLAAAISYWMWLYQPGSSIGFGSRKEVLVDQIGNTDSIMEKIRLMIRMTPPSLRPIGFDVNLHMPYMKITNPENGSLIKGESGPNIGRGGRSNLYWKDESAWYEQPEMIEAALSENTDVQIDISSVCGTDNIFYKRRKAGVIWEPEKEIPKGKTRVFIFDWRDHPGKSQEWYDQKRSKAEAEGLLHILAQEIDRNYTAAVEGIVIPNEWVRSAIDAHVRLKFAGNGDRIAALDLADGGGDQNALAVRNGPILLHCTDWAQGDVGESTRKAVLVCKTLKAKDMLYDATGIGAGAKAEGNRLVEDGLKFNFEAFIAGAGPDDPHEHIIPGDAESPTNKEFYLNKKAQGFWNLRLRFERTHKAVTKGEYYHPSQLISIPSTLPKLHDIVEELSQPTYKPSTTGKLLINKKGETARSPNLADAIMMAYSGSAHVQGDIFSWDWLKTCEIKGDILPHIDLLIQSVYPNFEDQAGGGYKSSITCAFFNPRHAIEKGTIKTIHAGPYPEVGMLVLDCWKDRMGFPKLREVIADDYNSIYGQNDREVDHVLIEESDSAKSLTKELGFAGVKCFSYNPGTRDKLALAHSVSHLVENGLIWFPQSSRVAGKAMDKFLPLIKEVIAYNRTPSQEYVFSFIQALSFGSDRGYLRTPEIGYREPEYNTKKKSSNPYAE